MRFEYTRSCNWNMLWALVWKAKILSKPSWNDYSSTWQALKIFVKWLFSSTPLLLRLKTFCHHTVFPWFIMLTAFDAVAMLHVLPYIISIGFKFWKKKKKRIKKEFVMAEGYSNFLNDQGWTDKVSASNPKNKLQSSDIKHEKDKFQIPIKPNKDNTEICKQILMGATIFQLRVQSRRRPHCWIDNKIIQWLVYWIKFLLKVKISAKVHRQMLKNMDSIANFIVHRNSILLPETWSNIQMTGRAVTSTRNIEIPASAIHSLLTWE